MQFEPANAKIAAGKGEAAMVPTRIVFRFSMLFEKPHNVFGLGQLTKIRDVRSLGTSRLDRRAKEESDWPKGLPENSDAVC